MEREDIDLDNFIREKIETLQPRGFSVEPTPDFCRRVMRRILSLEKRKCFYVLYGWAAILALGPLALRQLWLWIRNDYFSASNFPLGNLIVPTYHFVISFSGNLLLIAFGISFSVFFVLRTRHNELGGVGGEAKSVKIA